MPECHVNASSAVHVGDFIQLQCNVNYSGYFPGPYISCYNESLDGQEQTSSPAINCKSCSFVEDLSIK